jgi:hypothetical protein
MVPIRFLISEHRELTTAENAILKENAAHSVDLFSNSFCLFSPAFPDRRKAPVRSAVLPGFRHRMRPIPASAP